MAFPKDLRQKMINMMYLVLMAMLAINIDPAALDAFSTINKGMESSYNAFATKNSATADAITAKANEEKKENQIELARRANALTGASDDLDRIIDATIADVRARATTPGGKYVNDSKDPSDFVMITNDITTGAAANIKQKISEALAIYRATVEGAPDFTEEEIQGLISSFALEAPDEATIMALAENKDKKGWEEWTFAGKPAIAIEAMLNQLKNNAKATEGQILAEFAQKLDAKKIDIPYDIYNLALVPSSTYMQQGDAFKAKLSVGQSSSKAADLVKIFVNGTQLPVDGKGFATYTATQGVGEHTVDAYAIVTNPQTQETTRVDLDTPVKYQVAAPSATVSADKMNVLYVGLVNPLSVSAAGMSLNSVKANCTGCGSWTANGPGKYNAKPTAKGDATITITAGGKTMGSKKYRVMDVPDPQIRIGRLKTGSQTSAAALAAQGLVLGVLENFVFDAEFKVNSFTLNMINPSTNRSWTGRSNGEGLTGEMKSNLGRIGPGWYVSLTNVTATGPDGKPRKLGGAYYAIK